MRWLGTEIDRGAIAFDRIHSMLSLEDAARAWMAENYALLPSAFRPSAEDVGDFANLFASYLSTSFDLVALPAMRGVLGGCGCTCPFCLQMESLSKLQPKKLGSVEKARARRLEGRFIELLAREANVALAPKSVDAILDDPETREAAAMATYAWTLETRLAGEYVGAEVLALWRRFAWTKTGAPKKDFTLTVRAVLDAERCIAAAIAVIGTLS